MTPSYRPRDILDFWFAPEQEPRWFVKSEAFDAEIKDRFLPLYEAARNGALDDWANGAESLLALIIVLDQFSRNMFRGTVHAFATDDKALALTKQGIAQGFDKKLSGERLGFFYMPLMHSENLDDQNLSVALYERAGLKGHVPYAIAHRDIIARFGYFPHRNEIRGRKSTPEEIEFLKRPNSSF